MSRPEGESVWIRVWAVNAEDRHYECDHCGCWAPKKIQIVYKDGKPTEKAVEWLPDVCPQCGWKMWKGKAI